LEPVFAGQEAAVLEKIQALLGPEALAQHQEYTRRLGSNITAEQFKEMLAGDKRSRKPKRDSLSVMLEETQQTLVTAGLPADFQTVPMLNFRNIASETERKRISI